MSVGGDSVRSTMLDARVMGGCGDCGRELSSKLRKRSAASNPL